MNVGIRHTGHHAALHVRNAAMRIECHDIDLGTAAEGFDCRAAGIAGSRNDDGGALAALLKHMVHQPRDQLHRQVLEGERRPVEQL
jgi:hypothetical protein